MGRPRKLAAVDTMPPDLAEGSEPKVVSAPQRTPARQRLADAIETVRALEAEIAETSAAIEPAREANWAAQRVLDAAEQALKNARPRDTYLAPSSPFNSYWGSQAEAEAADLARAAAEVPPISIADAKAAVETAKDTLDTAKRLRQWHEDKLRNAEQRLQSDRYRIRDAVRAVLRAEPATLALAQECRRLTTRAAAAREAFRQIIHGDIIQPGSPYYGWDVAAEARSSPEAMADWSVSREWRAAIEALASDPDAVLPS